ncbi:MAG: 16S rRNA (cytidine(1402)-2'-O)-methyltransferase [Clostridia bacterium]|jgi:16S rRNA (cytidine1402-2'-O)-methyltransferase|nr:16S rRNA (cytidine(1402)-2'-O)-methyltransferase [Clostridia bacterium]MBQ1255591.1 16S rRNA (cytidine(1402)-2'-O)-methyltransferase [Clostridia bacterium]MBQ2253564.1 16S rRNA (cytidine(1402)-2'-O)-methyltransferase [Clostridia bacterium]MBQ5791773.1 16S rRNA (cytidine(1402)-2'-O)-methyltransferase [Clostridia bacterium]
MESSEMTGTLFIVGTPIGNLGDMSPRAVETLQNADLIAAEDTRTAAMLLEKFGITGAKILPNHKFNEGNAAYGFVQDLLQGKTIALVTDAGMPCVSDPGYLLVEAAVAAGVPVTAVPGPCAAVTAVAVSGFNALSFAFYGFLPRTAGDIRKVLRRVEKEYSPLSVFYESPNRITDTVELVGEVLPDFRVCVCNDLTKKFERIYRGTPEQVLEQLKSNPNASKGEYVLLLERSKTEQKEDTAKLSPEALLVDRMVKDGVSAKEAVALLTAEKVLPKRELYDAALRLRELL